DPAMGVDVSLNHERFGVDGTQSAEWALLQFRPGIQYQRNIFVIGLQLAGGREDSGDQAEDQDGASEARGSGNHEGFQGVFEADHQTFKAWTTSLSSLARDGETKLQAQVGGHVGTAHSGEQLLRLPQQSVFAGARGTGIEMLAQGAHLIAGDGTIEIGREQLTRLGTSQLCLRGCNVCGHVRHGVTSTLLPPPATGRRESAASFSFSCSSGRTSPNSSPTSRT